MIITIDGPTASGKSTTAGQVAQQLGFFYINSGFLFRGLAYAVLKEIRKVEHGCPDLSSTELIGLIGRLKYQYKLDQKAHMLFDGNDITAQLKDRNVAHMASVLGTDKDVRNALAAWQHQLANGTNVVVEGRDAGSVVFSGANLKIFLTASLPVRATRWQKEQAAQGIVLTEQEALRAVQERDERDSKRELAPLIVPAGALMIDNSSLTPEETIETIVRHAQSLNDV